MNIEKLNATITSSKVALSITILTFDYKVAFSFSIGANNKEACLFKCQKIYSNKKCILLTTKTFLVYFILSKSEGIMAFANGLI